MAGRSQPAGTGPAGDPAASQDAAAATAAYRVLLASFPQQKASLDENYAIAMDAIADGPAKETGRARTNWTGPRPGRSAPSRFRAAGSASTR